LKDILKKVNLKNLAFAFAPLAIAGFLYFIMLPISYIFLITSGLYASGFIIGNASHFIRTEDDMMKAWKFAARWWRNIRGEELNLRDAKAISRYFGDQKFFAFVVSRTERASEGKRYQDLVIIVSSNPLEIKYWNDAPTSEILEDPFKEISPVFVGSPSPSVKPELEPSLRTWGWKSKKEKKKERDEYESDRDVEVLN